MHTKRLHPSTCSGYEQAQSGLSTSGPWKHESHLFHKAENASLPMHPSIHGLGFVLCESTHNSLTDELLHADQKHSSISIIGLRGVGWANALAPLAPQSTSALLPSSSLDDVTPHHHGTLGACTDDNSAKMLGEAGHDSGRVTQNHGQQFAYLPAE
eukprot:scaffold265822_cov18-Tisochrysis_lutea.AAC.1